MEKTSLKILLVFVFMLCQSTHCRNIIGSQLDPDQSVNARSFAVDNYNNANDYRVLPEDSMALWADSFEMAEDIGYFPSEQPSFAMDNGLVSVGKTSFIDDTVENVDVKYDSMFYETESDLQLKSSSLDSVIVQIIREGSAFIDLGRENEVESNFQQSEHLLPDNTSDFLRMIHDQPGIKEDVYSFDVDAFLPNLGKNKQDDVIIYVNPQHKVVSDLSDDSLAFDRFETGSLSFWNEKAKPAPKKSFVSKVGSKLKSFKSKFLKKFK